MKTIEQELNDFIVTYPLDRIAPLEKILFVDIETTGFTAKSPSLGFSTIILQEQFNTIHYASQQKC